MRRNPPGAALALVAAIAACTSRPSRTSDTAFAAMQERGKMAMGVDQYTSTHAFDDLPDGGRIALVRDASDTLGVRQILRLSSKDLAAVTRLGVPMSSCSYPIEAPAVAEPAVAKPTAPAPHRVRPLTIPAPGRSVAHLRVPRHGS